MAIDEGSSQKPREDLQKIVESVADGKDAWGHEILLVVGTASHSFDYLLISTGSDGKLDVESIEEYFELEPVRRAGNPTDDIVYRDGEGIKAAWK